LFTSENRFNRILKEGFWVIIGQGMVAMASLVGVRLLTGLLNPSEYGELALGMTIATMVNQIILGPIAHGVMRFYAPAVEEDDIVGYLSDVRRLVSISTIVIICLMFFSLVILILMRQYQWIAITIASLIFASVSGYNTILSGIQNAVRQRSIVAIHQGTEYWLRFILAAVLISCLGSSSTIAMSGYVLGSIIVCISQSVYFLKAFPHHETWIDSKKIWQAKIWKYSWPMSVFGIFTWLQVVSDRWALGLFRSKDEVGMYAALFQLGYNPISMATGIAMQFLAPIFFQRSGDGNNKRRNAEVSRIGLRLTGLAIGLTGIAFCMSLLLHIQIFEVFVDRKYRSVSYLLPWMVLSGGIYSASQTIALNLMSQNKNSEMMPFKIMTALLGIVLNFVCGYYYGILGVIIANVIFSFSCLISMLILSRR
jgi:O-antigen/teichoic acid export membrane protein